MLAAATAATITIFASLNIFCYRFSYCGSVDATDADDDANDATVISCTISLVINFWRFFL